MEYELKEWGVSGMASHWARPDKPLTLPDFIEMSAKGEARMVNGVVHVKKDGPDPVLFARMNEAIKEIQKSVEKNFYEGTGQVDGLSKLFEEEP